MLAWYPSMRGNCTSQALPLSGLSLVTLWTMKVSMPLQMHARLLLDGSACLQIARAFCRKQLIAQIMGSNKTRQQLLNRHADRSGGSPSLCLALFLFSACTCTLLPLYHPHACSVIGTFAATGSPGSNLQTGPANAAEHWLPWCDPFSVDWVPLLWPLLCWLTPLLWPHLCWLGPLM